MTHLPSILINFLNCYHKNRETLLLGLSGGPDSLALFYLLETLKKNGQINFAVAHIDHNWRTESGEEAASLQKLANHFGICFHLKTLDPSKLKGNLEAACRSERLAFFKELCQKNHYEAVLLGHHADDQAETVLKRLLEGANLTALQGLTKESELEGMRVWRPFLDVKKKSILEWLKGREISAFHDATNFDATFLRAKMRLKMIPWLSKEFGKEVSRSLCHLGDEARELREYLESILHTYLEQIKEGPRGILLDLKEGAPVQEFEVKHLIRQFCKRGGSLLSREQIESASRFFIKAEGNCSFNIKGNTLFIDRKRLFLLHSLWEDLPSGVLRLEEGNFSFGEWRIAVKKMRNPAGRVEKLGWQAAWNGHLELFLPEEEPSGAEYFLGSPQSTISGIYGVLKEISLDKFWTNQKVPAFFRKKVPVIWKGNQIEVEFLSEGKKKYPNEYSSNIGWHVLLLSSHSA